MKHRIVVLGAGYAGAIAAGRLARRLHADDVEITLVNADADFVERVRLHQVATGQDLPKRPLRNIYAGTGVIVVEALVTAVDVDSRTVALSTGTLNYDSLVYALGSTVDYGVPGAGQHAHNVAGKQAAMRLRARLGEAKPGERVLVIGGGLTAIEAATEIAEAYPELRVALVARGGVGNWLSDKARRHLRGALDRLGIAVEQTVVTRVAADGVVTASGTLPAEVIVWTGGFAVHPIAAASTLAVSDTGRIIVDETMRSVSHDNVYAVGDAALADGAGGKPLRMSCASGTPMAWLAADALGARLTGRKVPETTIGYVLQCISLGRGDGIVQRVSPDDQPTSTVITGKAAARVKEFICAGAAWGVAHPTMLVPSRRRRYSDKSSVSTTRATSER